MKFSEAWLRTWVNPQMSLAQLGERLTLAGLEQDSIKPAAPRFSGVVSARIRNIEPRPAGNELKVCRVDDGEADDLQVVCAAPNARAGLMTAYARVGARLLGDQPVTRASVKGTESAGMLCAASELGLTETSSGLMVLPDDAPIGVSLWDYLELDDQVLDLELTPNRADCLSFVGLAREVAALTDSTLHAPAIEPVAAGIEERLSVDIQARADCPRYAGRVIRGIDTRATTPIWLQERLRRSGLRPVHPVVDVTNYVMLELGQPMHAFDLNTLTGGIRVRHADPGERLELLDGRSVTLDGGALVIADHAHALALAGIMGGADSAVGAHSEDVFLESAFFAPAAIAGRARALGLATDSSHRFERGVDPDLQVRGLERATTLILALAGGRAGPVIDVAHASELPRPCGIELRAGRIERLLGVSIADGEVVRILRALGCGVRSRHEDWEVTPPSFRFDLALEADLIEEIARVHGYERIPEARLPNPATIRPLPEAGGSAARLRAAMVDRGYQEAITYSFVDAQTNHAFDPEGTPKPLANPISSELGVMRTSLWPGLVRAARHNLHRQQPRVRLFETGRRFTATETAVVEAEVLAGVASGPALPEQWGASGRAVDFFDVKGDLEALCALAGRSDVIFERARHAALHPGQTARLSLQAGRAVGWLGAVHPSVQQAMDIAQPLYVFELELETLARARLPRFRALSRFPAVRRDLALVVDASVSASELRACIAAERVPQLQQIKLFDVYTGQGIAVGRKSLALGLIFQDLSRTLDDTEVDDRVARIVDRLNRELGAALRA